MGRYVLWLAGLCMPGLFLPIYRLAVAAPAIAALLSLRYSKPPRQPF